MKSFYFILIFIICLTGCIKKPSISGNDSSMTTAPMSTSSPTPSLDNSVMRADENAPTPVATPALPPSLYEEAEEEAQKWFDARVHQCGEYYRAAVGSNNARNVWFAVIQNEPEFSVEGEEIPPRSLSEAERLNGVDPQPVEWQGKINVTFGPYRINPTFMWQNEYKIDNVLYKKKGKWFTQEDQKIFQRPVLLMFKCSDIPANLRTE